MRNEPNRVNSDLVILDYKNLAGGEGRRNCVNQPSQAKLLRKKTMNKIMRLQVELDEEKMKELEAMMEEGKVRTKKEFINAALTLLRWAMREKRAGRIIASVDEAKDQYKEIDMPILSEVKQKDLRKRGTPAYA